MLAYFRMLGSEEVKSRFDFPSITGPPINEAFGDTFSGFRQHCDVLLVFRGWRGRVYVAERWRVSYLSEMRHCFLVRRSCKLQLDCAVTSQFFQFGVVIWTRPGFVLRWKRVVNLHCAQGPQGKEGKVRLVFLTTNFKSRFNLPQVRIRRWWASNKWCYLMRCSEFSTRSRIL